MISFFEYLSPFCFLSIEFHFAFSIFYKILPYFVYCSCKVVISLFPVSSTLFPKGCDSSLGGGWMIFHFRLFKSILIFVN